MKSKKRIIRGRSAGFVALFLAVLLFVCIWQLGGSPAAEPNAAETLEVTVLDVGQGDAIFVRQGEQAMLIDAGPGKASEVVVDYLTQEGVSKLDVLVGTHPHEDHIGGMEAVIDAVGIQTLYMPKVQANTKTFEGLLDSMARNGLKAKEPKPGDTFSLGGAECTVLAPVGNKYKDLNNNSIVLHVRWGDTSFLFCGDAEKESEEEMLASGLALSATVLKVGHHGSSSSTTQAFLKAVRPQIAVISLASDNTYGHPHQEALEALREITLYRTDTHGTVAMISDGKEVDVTCQK